MFSKIGGIEIKIKLNEVKNTALSDRSNMLSTRQEKNNLNDKKKHKLEVHFCKKKHLKK